MAENDAPRPISRKKKKSEAAPDVTGGQLGGETVASAKKRTKRTKELGDEHNLNNSNTNRNSQAATNSGLNPTSTSSTAVKAKRRRRKLPEAGSKGSITSTKDEGIDNAGFSTTSMRSKGSVISGTQKRTRRKRVKSPVSGMIETLGVDLADIQDDIMDPGTDPESDQETKAHQHMLRSQPVGKLYIEQSSGFKATDKGAMDEHYDNQRARDDDSEEPSFPVKITSMAFALQTTHAFKTFSHFCMGVLAGLAVWQTVYSFTMTNNDSYLTAFLELYRYSSVPINCVFYVLLVFATVATFDRYDIAKLNRQFLLKACTLQSGAVACVLYTAAMCINVSLAPLDDRLGVRVNGTADLERTLTAQERDKVLMSWRVLTSVRAVMVTLAWFIVSIRPATHRLTKNLSQSEVTWGNPSTTTGEPQKRPLA